MDGAKRSVRLGGRFVEVLGVNLDRSSLIENGDGDQGLLLGQER